MRIVIKKQTKKNLSSHKILAALSSSSRCECTQEPLGEFSLIILTLKEGAGLKIRTNNNTSIINLILYTG